MSSRNPKSTTATIQVKAPFVQAAELPQKKVALPISTNQLVTDAAEPKYTLVEQATAIADEVGVLRDEINTLRQILDPIMVGEQAPTDVKSGPAGYRMSSPLGSQLEQVQVAIRQLTLQVRSLAARVELV